MKNLMLIAAVIMILIAACSPPPQAEELVDEAAIKAEIESLMAEVSASAEKMSTAALQKYLSDAAGDTFYLGSLEYTKAELIAAIAKAYEPFLSQTLTTSKSSTRVMGPQHVMWKALMESTAIQKDGATAEMKLTETWIWEKTDAGWKVIHYDESW